MRDHRTTEHGRANVRDNLSFILSKIAVVLLISVVMVLGALASVAWATPSQDPQRQTVPSPTPDPAVVDPVITKRGTPADALPGELVTFTLQVTNLGRDAAVGVVVVDEVPEYLHILTVTTTQGTVVIAGQRVIIDVGTVGPGFLVEITIATRVSDDVPAPIELLNAALLTSHNGGSRETPPVRVWIPGLLPETGRGDVEWTGLLVLSVALTGIGLVLLRSASFLRRG